MKFTLVSGTGNNFALFDGFDGQVPEDPRAAALELCSAPLATRAEFDANLPAQFRLDGILLLQPAREAGACRMVIYNADSSRPESCGNGLRCIALVARARYAVSGVPVDIRATVQRREPHLPYGDEMREQRS